MSRVKTAYVQEVEAKKQRIINIKCIKTETETKSNENLSQTMHILHLEFACFFFYNIYNFFGFVVNTNTKT